MVGLSGSKSQGDQLFGNVLKQVHPDNVKLKPTIAKFISGLGAPASSIQVEAIHVKRSSFVYETKLQSFNLLSEAMTKKCNDNPILKIGWYGASKEEIVDIITIGLFDQVTVMEFSFLLKITLLIFSKLLFKTKMD